MLRNGNKNSYTHCQLLSAALAQVHNIHFQWQNSWCHQSLFSQQPKYWTLWQPMHPVRAVWSIRWFWLCYYNNQNSTTDQARALSWTCSWCILWCQARFSKGNKKPTVSGKTGKHNTDSTDMLAEYGVDTSMLVCNPPRSKIIMLALHWNKPWCNSPCWRLQFHVFHTQLSVLQVQH